MIFDSDYIPQKCEESVSAHLIFLVSNCSYAVETSYVLEIVEIKHVTALPRTAPYVLGVTKIRDTIYSVMDLRIRFGTESEGRSPAEPAVAIVLKYNGAKICMVVDKVIVVADIDFTKASNPATASHHIRGVVQVNSMKVALLSIDCLFKD